MKPPLHHPYVRMVLSQELRDVLTVMVTFSPPSLCADGTEPGVLGCSNNDETSSPHPYVRMVLSQELRDVLTVMVNSLHHPYVQMVLSQEF